MQTTLENLDLLLKRCYVNFTWTIKFPEGMVMVFESKKDMLDPCKKPKEIHSFDSFKKKYLIGRSLILERTEK